MRFSWVLPALVLPLVCQAADKPMALPELVAKVQAQALKVAGSRKIRLAVVPFTPASEQRFRDRGFGGFLTERIFASLGSAGPAIRLFERGRLDAVLKEQKLSASGLFNEGEAKRLGELVPLDYLLTGTFTRLEGSVAVHGRLIDVVSGEIPATFSEQVALTPDLAALFEDARAESPAAPSAAEARKPKVDPCEATWAPFKPLMEDLGTPEKVDRLVEAAVAIPFEPPCGALHHTLVRHLLRYKLRSPRYAAFLQKTLAGVQDPDGDERISTILRFLKADGELEPAAWTTAFEVFSRSGRFLEHLDDLLRGRDKKAVDQAQLLERCGRILEAVAKGRIGKPLPLKPGEAFTAILSELSSVHLSGFKDQNPAPVLAYYRSYGAKYAAEGDKRLVERLIFLLRILPQGADRAQAITWLGERLARFGAMEPLASDMGPFLDRLFDQRKEERKKGEWSGPAAQELDRLAALAGPPIAQILPHLQGRGYRLNTQAFCLEHGIAASGVPTEAELMQQLEEGDRTAQEEALGLLTALGPRAKGSEAALVKLLRRAEATRDWDSPVKYHVRAVMEGLAALGTKDPEALRLMIRHLGSLETVISDSAILALARLGGTAIPAIQAAYPKQEHLVKMRMAEVFRKMGPAARPALPWLKARIDEKETSHLQIAFEDAVARIEKAK